MKRLTAYAALSVLVTGAAIAGPLDGVGRNAERNKAVVDVITSDVDGNDYAIIDKKGTIVLLGEDSIGVTAGHAGDNANDNSVVGPFVGGGCEGRTRIDLPGGGGSPCEN